MTPKLNQQLTRYVANPVKRLCLVGAIASLASLSPQLVRAEQAMHGLAAWYGPGFSGNRTANGEVFDPHGLTAAHRSLPFGTEVRVTNVQNGQSVVVRINDRLGDPNILIDLSMGAARQIGLTGTSRVKMEILGR